MVQIVIYSGLALFGAALGSFIAATVWRIRARQLEADKKQGLSYDKKEYGVLKRLLGKKVSADRSQCLHCHTTLRWYELIPIVSWVAQRGRCRSCKKPIGWFEITAEVGVAAFFVLSYALWPAALTAPLEVTHFILWLVAGVIMALLFAYDMKWFLLPDVAMLALMAVGLAITGVSAAESGAVAGTLLSAAGAVGVLGGLYALIYFGSKGQWVGFGDVLLGAALGLVLVDWKLSLVALFMANFVGCLIVIPLMLAGKLTRTARVPFGPLLITGALVAWFAGPAIIDWYVGGMGLAF